MNINNEQPTTDTTNTAQETEDVFKETEDVFKETENVFKETEDVFKETENVFNETQDVFKETEITAGIILPEEGGWGWVVVAASFSCMFILDGIFYTFGSIFKDIADDLQTHLSLVALANSIAIALYFLLGPLVSAFINRYGFRISGMFGSVLISFGYFTSTFVKDYVSFLICYGIIPGIGSCFVNMTSEIVVGFYFERLRALAVAIAGLGGSLGVSVMYNVNSNIVNLAGWRTLTMMHSGFFGFVYFLSMAYRPLLSLTMVQAEDTQVITYLPSLETIPKKPSVSRLMVSTVAERRFKALSNVHFPTAAEVLEEPDENTIEPSSSSTSKQEITFKATDSQSGLSSRQLKHCTSIKSCTNLKGKVSSIIITLPTTKPPTLKKHCVTWCHPWEKHDKESRPMYRDDVFYRGRLADLPVYQKYVTETDVESRIGIEYHIAVTRAAARTDLQDQKGVCTTAFRRILATMLDTTLLKRKSFIIVCSSGFLTNIGMLPMYVFLPDRNRENGVPEVHSTLFVSTIGIANAIGELLVGSLSCKFSPIRLFYLGYIIAGLSVIFSTISYNAYYQYICCAVFGVSIGCGTLRSPVLVKLYDLEKLTNATGILLMFQGFGILLSTPLSSMLTYISGYTLAFYVSGTFIVTGALILINIQRVVESERNALIGKYTSVTKWKTHPKNVEIMKTISETWEPSEISKASETLEASRVVRFSE